MVPTTTIIPIKPFYEIKDPSGIEKGNYSNMSFQTFGLNDNLNNWTINILFTQFISGSWQGIIGNMNNWQVTIGWGIWINSESKIY